MSAQNTQPQVWLYSLGKESGSRHFQTIADQLHALQITWSDVMPPAPKSVALLLIEEDDAVEHAEELLQDILSQGIRSLALCMSEKPLPFFKVSRLLNLGVDDVLNWRSKFSLADILQARLQRWAVIDRLLDSDRVRNTLVGSSSVWQQTLRQVIEMACFTSAPALILGESGTGKELVARLIHDLDRRPDKQDLVLLDCTTIVPELSGSEFFGHEKGAFTNAISTRDGAFALADRGTLFLDEVGELPLRLQAELLRVSQEGLYKRVGSNTWKKTQFRLVCATNRDLLQEVEKGNFRQDLYYRLGACVIRLPSLRERRLDIPELAAHFLCEAFHTDLPPSLDPWVLNFLLTQDYPGNVRQLRQFIARISYRHVGRGAITIGDIPNGDRESFPSSETAWQENGFKDAIRHALVEGVGLKEIKRIAADVAMDLAIEASSGNLQMAAQRLCVTDRTLQAYQAARKYGLPLMED